MKKIIIIMILPVLMLKANAQSQELEQLALNIEKLAQFKQILSDLKKAYEILYGGYTTIRNISEGNFDLHRTFLDGLLKASPAVQKYRKVADIILMQLQLVKEYRAALARFKNNNWFRTEEIDYINKVYTNLFNQSLRHLDDLTTVLTANQLRMTDDERLSRIDKIFEGMQDKLVYLRHFNSGTSVLGIQRSKEKTDVDVMQQLHGVK